MSRPVRNALVIGGTPHGMGAAIAERLSRDGFAVIEWDGTTVDLTHPEVVSERFRELGGDGKEPEIVVHASAPFGIKEDFDALVAADLRARLVISQSAAALTTPRKFGRIVHVLAPLALRAPAVETAEWTARSGAVGMVRALARQLAPSNITVNAVAPGFLDPALPKEWLKRIPLTRVGTAAEVAGLVRMLCDERASYITGQCLSIDGGLS
jgi:NAD(P)-dependent dehydrogenase (short-subunit alcohol dehydrogenase family)